MIEIDENKIKMQAFQDLVEDREKELEKLKEEYILQLNRKKQQEILDEMKKKGLHVSFKLTEGEKSLSEIKINIEAVENDIKKISDYYKESIK